MCQARGQSAEPSSRLAAVKQKPMTRGFANGNRAEQQHSATSRLVIIFLKIWLSCLCKYERLCLEQGEHVATTPKAKSCLMSSYFELYAF